MKMAQCNVCASTWWQQGGLSDKMYVAVHNVMFRLVKKSQGGVSAYKKIVRRELNAWVGVKEVAI